MIVIVTIVTFINSCLLDRFGMGFTSLILVILNDSYSLRKLMRLPDVVNTQPAFYRYGKSK